MQPNISGTNPICNKKSCEYFKIQFFLHEKSDESFLKAPLLELHLTRIENIPEFVIKFSTG